MGRKEPNQTNKHCWKSHVVIQIIVFLLLIKIYAVDTLEAFSILKFIVLVHLLCLISFLKKRLDIKCTSPALYDSMQNAKTGKGKVN